MAASYQIPSTGGPTRPGTKFGRFSVPIVVNLIGITAILYVGREVFLPLAIALLLTFALAPIVSLLRKASLPKIPSVALTVTLAIGLIGLFSAVVATQVANLAQNVPVYQTNILEKVRALREIGTGAGLIDRLTGVIERVGDELERTTQPETTREDPDEPEPVPVEIVPRQGVIETLKTVVLPLVSPFATAGLILVVVIFMLIEREDLRDRFIRLVSYGDIHRTTVALQDAGARVGRYLLMQLVVNTLYAVPITLGLIILGIPNAILWGLLTLILRFVPYIGPALGMVFPLFLAFAVSPGWSLLVWTAGLFLLMELISNNLMEPWLYGSRTGLSPLAIIVAAIFWTWLWGPLGLVLSTPLTVCLVVLGRHVPDFAFLDVLLGDEPVLEPHARLYQRLLAGDPDEATDQAEQFLETGYLVDFYDRVGLPALLLGEEDRQRGVMLEAHRTRFAESAKTLVANLEEIADEEGSEEEVDLDPEKADGEPDPRKDEPRSAQPDLPDGEGRSLICVGGRGEMDEAAAAMLAQLLKVQGATASVAPPSSLEVSRIRDLPADGVETVILVYLNWNSTRHARLMIRRLKRLRKDLRVGVLMAQPHQPQPLQSEATLRDINADFVATTIVDAVTAGLSDTPAVPLRSGQRHLISSRARGRTV